MGWINDRQAAVVRALEHAERRGAIKGWRTNDKALVVELPSHLDGPVTLRSIGESELFCKGLAAGLSGHVPEVAQPPAGAAEGKAPKP